MDDDIPYLLLTPGPLTTTRTVRAAMGQDYCTWDDDYKSIVGGIRNDLVAMASSQPETITAVLMQGSGTFAVESALGSLIPSNGKVAIINNGAYGARMVEIARRLAIPCVEIRFPEHIAPDLSKIEQVLAMDNAITHVAVVHCETTTGMLNPVKEAGEIAQSFGKIFIVDAMSSFGGIPMSMEDLKADVLISSANKCIQGVPGFAFVIVKIERIQESKGWARSLSLDLYDQWRVMEEQGGKWRYTSPTHVVRAFAQALKELQDEGGPKERYSRYRQNQQTLWQGMSNLGFRSLLPREIQSPIITSFYYPSDPRFDFDTFYKKLKQRRYVIYPGKISHADTFRIGTIGNVFPTDIEDLIMQIGAVVEELQLQLP